MPKDNIERAIKRANDKSTENYKEVLFEGYAPHGIAVLASTELSIKTLPLKGFVVFIARVVAKASFCFFKRSKRYFLFGAIRHGV